MKKNIDQSNSDSGLSFSLHCHKRFWHTLIIAIAIVLVWRSIWGLADMYLFPNNPLLSHLVSLFLGILFLYLPDNNIDELLPSIHLKK
ncbi:MAG: hypothetical protein PHP74_02760 [Candidatus Gracilibacteria bacterium]|nr:hypothetical protein [Candidatus Gracilibacteria bacterium]